MTYRYHVPFPPDGFDLRLCVTTGQVFRWVEASPGVWTGFDGADAYQVTESVSGYSVVSTAPETAFRRLFRLDLDFDVIRQELVRLGPELEPYTAGLSGLRLMRPSSPVEATFSFLCTANNHIKRIGPMVRNLASFGEAIGEIGHGFPTVETIATLPPATLRQMGFGYRADTVVLSARELLQRGGEGYLLELQKQSYERAEAELRSLPYVGRKLADCIALYALNQTEAVPLDTHMWQAMTRLYFPEWQGHNLTDLRYRTAAEFLRDRFGRLAGYAQQLLFLENLQNWRSRRKVSELVEDPVKG